MTKESHLDMSSKVSGAYVDAFVRQAGATRACRDGHAATAC